MSARTKPRDERVSTHVQTTLSGADFARLERLEAELRCSRAETIRRAIAHYAAAVAQEGGAR